MMQHEAKRYTGHLMTEQASTSGTSIDFTGIPPWVKRITVMLVGVSTNGTSRPLIQIGDSGGVETSGYLGASGDLTVPTHLNFSAGFEPNGGSAANVWHGAVTLALENAANNTWVAWGVLGLSNGAATASVAGTKSLSATLDRVRVTTVNGTDTFDAGAINVLYE